MPFSFNKLSAQSRFSLVIVTMWGLLLLWVWLGNGAETVVRFRELFGFPDSPQFAKFFLSSIVIIHFVTITAFKIRQLRSQ